jgi:tetratricopeptide (TPR) repeat protein
MDDDFVIFKNEQNLNKSDAVQNIFKSYYSDTEKSRYEYRPLVKLSFMLDYMIWKDNPHYSHAVNLLLFLLTLLILFNVLHKLFAAEYPWLPLLAVLIFAAHPIHTEVVASLKNRDELMSFFFSMSTLILMMIALEKKKFILFIPAIVLYFLAYLSKSSALVFAALIPLTLYFHKKENLKFSIIMLVVLLASAWFMRYYPKTFLPDGHRDVWFFENPLYEHRGILFRLGTGLIAILFYIRLLIFPYPLRFYYGYDMLPLSKFPDALSIIALLVLSTLFVFAIIKLKKRHPLSYGILFFLIAISMFSNIVRPAVGIVAERYAYAASFGFAIALAYLILFLSKSLNNKANTLKMLPSRAKYIILFILIIFAARSISRNTVWEDHLSLYYNDIKHLDQSFKANLLIANTLQSEVLLSHDQPKLYQRNIDYLNDAEIYYRKALEIYDGYPNAWNSYGSLKFMFRNDPQGAIPFFKKATSLDPGYTEAWFNLGFSFQKLATIDSAKFYFEKCIMSDNSYQRAYTQKGICELSMGDTSAFYETQAKLQIAAPKSDAPYINIGNLQFQIGDTTHAIANWEKAAELAPDNPTLLTNLANFFLHTGNQEKYNYYYQLHNQIMQERRQREKEWQ